MIINFSEDITIGSKALIEESYDKESFTEGNFENDYLMIEKTALRNNLSEEEAFSLIEKIRSKLPMNQ